MRRRPSARGALCDEIRRAIQEAIYGRGILRPIWSEYCQAVDSAKIVDQVRDLQQDMKDLRGGLDQLDRPSCIEYWHPPTTYMSGFVGRSEELALLFASDGAHSVQLVHGIGGIGKTALVVEFVRQVADRYPDGRVFVDFQSYSREATHTPKSPGQALAELLPQCGVDHQQIAGMNLQQREIAWRQKISGRRMLFVWDNVGDVAQIRPLLTGQPDFSTFITSRSELDLAAASIPLAPLIESDDYALFESVAGKENCAEQADLVAEAARLCAWMPLQINLHGF